MFWSFQAFEKLLKHRRVSIIYYKNMSPVVEISSVTTTRFICVYYKQIIPWVVCAYDLDLWVWNISLTRSVRSLLREIFQIFQTHK